MEKILFYLLVFCLPLQVRHIFYFFGENFNEWRAISLWLSDILLLTFLGMWLSRSGGDLLRRAKRKFVWRCPEVWLGFFLLISLFSIGLADNKWLGIYGWLKLIEMVGLFLYIRTNFLASFDLKKFWQAYIAGAVLQALIAIGQFFRQGDLGLKWLGESPLSPEMAGVAKIVINGEKIMRAYGATPHPNVLAAILVVGLFGVAFLWLTHYWSAGAVEKTVYAVSVAMMTIGLFFAFSRGATVIGLAVLLFWLISAFFGKGNLKRPVFFFVLFSAAVFLLLVVIYWPVFSRRFGMAGFVGQQAIDLRTHYNLAALEMIKESPWLGIGQGNFVSALGQYYTLFADWLFQPAHNIYFLIASENGILGAAVFIAFLTSVLKPTLVKSRSVAENCFLGIFCFIILSGLIDHFWWDLQQGRLLFWLMLGMFSVNRLADGAENFLAPRVRGQWR